MLTRKPKKHVSIQLTLSQKKGAGKGAPGKRPAGRWSDADEDVDGSPGGYMYSNVSDTRSVAQRMANASFGAGASRDQDDLT